MFHNLLISYLIILFLPTLITKKIHAVVDNMKNDFHKMLLSYNVEHYSSMKHVHKESAKITHRDDIQQGNTSPKNHIHQVIIACKHRNLDILESMLLNVSNPYHQDYGKYLSDEQVKDLTLNPESARHIQKYLEYNGIQILNTTLNKEYMIAETTISKWELIFNTVFYEFSSKSDPTMKFHRALSYSLPNELEHHVSNVFNTVQFPDIQYTNVELRKKSLFRKEILIDSTDIDNSNKPHKNVEVKDHVTPALLNRVYNIPSNLGDGYGSQAIYATIGQTYSPSDLTYFQKYFQITVENVAFDIGGHAANNACQKNQGQDCGEANLDVQYIMATAQKVPTTYYYWAGEDFLLDWILEVTNIQKPPLVFSISYGADESYMSASYAEEFDIAAMKLGIRGVTILASSGDDGAISSSARSSSMNCGYNPSFPATSPYVTSVGGTMGPEKGNPETVCQGDLHGVITSGGGFSTLYGTPSWQLSTIKSYFNKIGNDKGGIGSKAPAPGFNRNGRGYPDVSAVATEYAVVYNNKLSAVSGTSASSPFVAGLISLVNAARLKAGLSSLGWINPSLYMLDSSTFIHDIIEGANNCVAMGKVCCAHGFSAVDGWDPTTGLGSINFDLFKTALMNIGNNPNSPTLSPTVKPGMPTPLPTMASSNTPTDLPSQAPTIGAGWMSLEQYTKTNCDGEVTVVSGVATGQCFIEYDNTLNQVGSVQYICDNEKATALYYSNNYCSEKFLIGAQYYGLGCAMFVEDTYYSDNPYSTSLSCSKQNNEKNMQFVPPVPDGIVPYAMQSSYDSLTGCIGTAISEYTLYLENYCFDISDQGYSYMINFPNVIFYPAPKCISKKPQTDSLPTTCEAVSTDDYGGYYQNYYSSYYQLEQGSVDLYVMWSELHGKAPVPSHDPTISPSGPSSSPTYNPSYSPTVSPSGPTYRPTYYPSSIPVPSGTTLGENIEITIQQLLDGLDLSQYRKDKDSGDGVLKRALAACLLLIQPTDISIKSIVEADIDVARKYLRSSNTNSLTIKTLNSLQHFFVLSYTINFNTFEVGFTSSSSAYKTYLQQLNNALINGVFDAYLHQYAIIFNVASMQSVSTPASTKPIISSGYTSTLNTASSDPSNSSISSFSIAIIISMIAVVVIGIIFVYNRNKQQSLLASSSTHMYNTSNHTVDTELQYDGISTTSTSEKQLSYPRRMLTRTSNAIKGTSRRMIRSSKKLIQQASTKNKRYKDRIRLSQEDDENDDNYNDDEMVEIQLNESAMITSTINPISSNNNSSKK